MIQFSTELMFIAMKPFGLEFFGVLLLKALLHITIKGGLMFKLHTKLRTWLVALLVLSRL